MFSRAVWPRVLPFLTYMLFIVVADLAARCGASAEQIRWIYPLKIFTVVALLVVFWGRYDELRGTRLSWRAIVLASIAGVVVWWLWIHLNANWMVLGQGTGFDPRDSERLNWPLVLVRLVGAVAVVPLMEELFWRSFLLRWLSNEKFEVVPVAHISWRNIVVSSALFGVEHNTWFAGVIAGIVYAFLYWRSANLWLAVLAHAVTNGVLGVWIISTGSWQYW